MADPLSLFPEDVVVDQVPALTTYDWIVVSSSAGKDSMAMLDHVVTLAEAAGVLHRVVVVHCDLGRVEWPGTKELAEQQAARYGVRFVTVWRRQGDLLEHIERVGFWPRPTTRYCTSDHKRDQIIRSFTALADEKQKGDLLSEVEGRGKWPSPKVRFCTSHHKQSQVDRLYTALSKTETTEAREGDLLDQIEQRGMFPDPARRYCTSDQKRAPIHKLYTTLVGMEADETALPQPKRAAVRILSCQGMRADESPARAKRPPFHRDDRASNGKRHVDNWLPIHRWTEEAVWERIRGSRISDLVHHAYGLGMPRLSCCFCIFAPKAALVLAGRHNPELLAEYVAVEERIGHKFRLNLSMRDVQDAVNAGETAQVANWKM